MPLQPAAVVFPDVELWATTYLRAALAARSEPVAAGVGVANDKAKTSAVKKVVVRRDGGPQRGLFDFPRLTVRVWAPVEQDASDLARLVQALLIVSPGSGPVVAATSLSGPQGVPDDSGPQKYMSVELKTRGVNL